MEQKTEKRLWSVWKRSAVDCSAISNVKEKGSTLYWTRTYSSGTGRVVRDGWFAANRVFSVWSFETRPRRADAAAQGRYLSKFCHASGDFLQIFERGSKAICCSWRGGCTGWICYFFSVIATTSGWSHAQLVSKIATLTASRVCNKELGFGSPADPLPIPPSSTPFFELTTGKTTFARSTTVKIDDVYPLFSIR